MTAAVIADIERLLPLATRATSRAILEAELAKQRAAVASSVTPPPSAPPLPPAPLLSREAAVSSGPTYSTIHKYAFDQSKKFVKIYITLPGIEDLDDSKVRLEVGNGDELVFEVVGLPKPGPPNVRLAARALFSPVDPTQCTWARKSDSMILLKLRKKEEGEEWGSLDDSARIAAKRKEEKLVENKGKSTQGACVLRVPSPPPCK